MTAEQHIDHPMPHRPGYRYEVHAVPGFGITEFEYLDDTPVAQEPPAPLCEECGHPEGPHTYSGCLCGCEAWYPPAPTDAEWVYGTKCPDCTSVRPPHHQRWCKQHPVGSAQEPPELLGYMVVARRPDRQGGGLRYESAGGIWPDIEPCENHQAYCEMTAADKPERYGDVEYVIVEIRNVP